MITMDSQTDRMERRAKVRCGLLGFAIAAVVGFSLAGLGKWIGWWPPLGPIVVLVALGGALGYTYPTD